MSVYCEAVARERQGSTTRRFFILYFLPFLSYVMYGLALSARISLLSSSYKSDCRTINADVDDDDYRDDHGVQKYMRMSRSIATLFTAGIQTL